ncbi:MAG: hypothetical protein PUJ12_01340, partial [Oscillospiraceae bacterium]|nr:hypothetical protein [Oscillospiraceae bacterium]
QQNRLPNLETLSHFLGLTSLTNEQAEECVDSGLWKALPEKFRFSLSGQNIRQKNWNLSGSRGGVPPPAASGKISQKGWAKR